MQKFKEALNKTLVYEGGYVNDEDDAGGETYKGISRRFNPSWVGWNIIEKAKLEAPEKFPKILDDNIELQESLADLYKQLYWDRFWGDAISSEEITEKLFDISVNLGVKRAVIYLQEGLNLLNRNQKNYNDIGMDGVFGKNTLKVLVKYLDSDKPDSFLKIISILQGMHYIDYMRRSPKQEKYARGWLKRV